MSAASSAKADLANSIDTTSGVIGNGLPVRYAYGMSSVAGFQELAMGEPRRALLLDWGARVLYIGPAFGLTPHRNATGVLAVALDGPIDVADNPRARTPSW